MNARSLLGAAAAYVRRHPEEVVRAARNALGRRFGVPLDAVRSLLAEVPGAPRDLDLVAVPPGLRVAGTLDVLGNRVRAAGVVYVESVVVSSAAIRLELRLDEVDLVLLEAAPDSPVAMLLKSGVLDLSKPGNLAAHLPRRPPFIVEAGDDRIVLDLMKHPRVAGLRGLERVLAVVTPMLTVARIETDWEHLDLVLRPVPAGVGPACAAVRLALSGG